MKGRQIIIGLLLIGLLLPRAAYTQEGSIHLIVHGLSKHGRDLNSEGKPYRESNPGLGVRYRFAQSADVQAGCYRNSYDRNSCYAGFDWTPVTVLGLDAGVFGGLTNHYPMNNGGIVPTAGLILRAQFERLSLAVRAAPAIAGKSSGVVALEIGFRL